MQKPSQELRAKAIKIIEQALSRANHPIEQASGLEVNLYNRANSADEYLGMVKAFCSKIGVEVGPTLRALSAEMLAQQQYVGPAQFIRPPSARLAASAVPSTPTEVPAEMAAQSSSIMVTKPTQIYSSPSSTMRRLLSRSPSQGSLTAEPPLPSVTTQSVSEREQVLFKYCAAYIPRLRVFCQQQQGKLPSDKLQKIKNILDLLEGRIRVPAHFLSRCKEYLENTFPDVHARERAPQSAPEGHSRPPASEQAAAETPRRADDYGIKVTKEELMAAFERFFGEATLDHRCSVARDTRVYKSMDAFKYPETYRVNAPSEWPADALATKKTPRLPRSFLLLKHQVKSLPPDTYQVEILNEPAFPGDAVRLKCRLVDPELDVLPPMYIKAYCDNDNVECTCWNEEGELQFDRRSAFPEIKRKLEWRLLMHGHRQPFELMDFLEALRISAEEYHKEKMAEK